jgi:SAM-dependent methyltransferase
MYKVDIYDLEYYENMLREYSKTAEQICKIRWKILRQRFPKARRILDFGCGVGWFRAWRPKGMEVHCYDIADVPQTGLDIGPYDVVCFWDVLEHLYCFDLALSIMGMAAMGICVTVPIFTGEVSDLKKWKHYKPDEHLTQFTLESLDALVGSECSFDRAWNGPLECPPRLDIETVIYRRGKDYI